MTEELPFLIEDIDKNRVIVILMAIFPILFFLPLVTAKDSRYAMYFANQTLLVFIASAVCGIVPVIGWICEIIVAVMYVLNIVHAVQAEPKGIPILGNAVIIHYENLA